MAAGRGPGGGLGSSGDVSPREGSGACVSSHDHRQRGEEEERSGLRRRRRSTLIMTTLFIPATNLIERDFHFLNGVGLFSE